ncbi:MAG: hypothetical protein WBA51_19690 [Erythrobacter sp.]
MTNSDNSSTGEQRLRARRRSFWRFMAIGAVVSALAGFFAGFFSGALADGAVPLWATLALLAAAVAGMAWFTFDYFRRIDEVDLLDNFWAHLWGQYIAVTVFLVWYFLAELKLVIYPSAFAIICAMILGTFGIYGLRKLGLR